MDSIIDSVLLFIKDNLDSKLTLKQLSSILDINYCYLSSEFKKRKGISFSQYKKSLRIEKAKTQLKESSLEIKEIASELGYKSLSNFYSDFTQFVGISPKTYRKENIQASQNLLEKIQRFSRKSKKSAINLKL